MKSQIKRIAVSAALVSALEIAKCQHPYLDGVCQKCGKLQHTSKVKKERSNE